MVQIILLQMLGQQAAQESGLSTTLTSNERRHYLIAMKRVHLQPMGHHSTKPGSQEGSLLCADAWNAREEVGHIVVSIPFGQRLQIVNNRIERLHLFRFHIQLDQVLGIALLQDTLTQHSQHDAVLGLQRQGSPIATHALSILGCILHLTVQYIATEKVILLKVLLDDKHTFR